MQRPFKIMKHIHLPWAFFVKSGILQTSVYNVYGSQNEFVSSVTRVFILRIAQSWAEWPSTTGCRICGSKNSSEEKSFCRRLGRLPQERYTSILWKKKSCHWSPFANIQSFPIFNLVQYSILSNIQSCPIFNLVQYSILSNIQSCPIFNLVIQNFELFPCSAVL